MGEMAELYDYLLDEEDEIAELMELDDAELIRMSSKSRTPKIMSIRRWGLEGKPLSTKQRYCLAFWIDAHCEGETNGSS
jgi:hypothetical protein